ncbi:MAG: hypothetical protein ACD_7C00556G0001 [uncultured bacterium]|nr:MAG: hypothetical protein ACD_7C00556G0001 [uncultured bacterium]
MEIRTYFNKRSIQSRLRKTGLYDSQKDHFPGNYNKCSDDPTLGYFKQTSLLEKLPKLLEGLKPTKISLHEMLPLEQNMHMAQGCGSFGESRYAVSFGDESYNMGDHGYGWKAVIRINITGKDRQSISDCYKKIRSEGNLPGKSISWKGAAAVPSHCKQDLQEEMS